MLFSISILCVLFFQVATKLFKCKYFLSFWTWLLSKKNYSEFFCSFVFWLVLSFGEEKAMAPHSSTLGWKIPWTVAHQALLSLGFSRQKYWSELPCPPPGDLPDSGTKPNLLCLLHCRWILYPMSHVGSPYSYYSSPIYYHLLPKSLQLSCNWSSRFCYCSSNLFLLFLKFQSDHITSLHKPFKGPI